MSGCQYVGVGKGSPSLMREVFERGTMMRTLDKAGSGKILNPNYSSIITNFCSSYQDLHKKFGVPLTPKFHIIQGYLKYYFDETNKSLGYYTNQLVEAMHQYTDRVICRSNYHVKNLESDKHGEKLLPGVHHLNSYNL